MSYNQGYGQPQAHMPQGMQLPYPMDRLMFQPVHIQPGNPPVLPAIPYLPQGLQQYYPFIVSSAMDEIQRKANTNPMRVFMFNQMGQNNWNNPDFAQFIDGLVRLIDMHLSTGKIRDINQAIQMSTDYFAQINAAINVQSYPAMMNFLPPQLAQGVNEVLTMAAATQMEMKNYFARMAQPAQMAYGAPTMQQPAMGGYGYQPQGQAVNFQQAHQRHALVNAGVGPGSAPSNMGGYGSNVFASTSNDPIAARFESRARPPAPPAPPAPAAPAQQHTTMFGVPGAVQPHGGVVQPTQAAAPVAAPAAQQVIANDSVPWIPSEKRPVNIAFDPTKTKLVYQYLTNGEMSPHPVNKEPAEMDITKHLATPSFVGSTPPGAETLDTRVRRMETERSLEDSLLDLEKIEPIKDLNVALLDDKRVMSDSSLEDLWAINEVALQLMRKKLNRANLHRMVGAHYKPLVTARDPRSMINAIAQAASFEAACKIMRGYVSRFEQQDFSMGDQKALAFINRRLTDHLNDFLAREMAVPTAITSFMEDAPGVPQYLADKFGQAFGAQMVTAQGQLLEDALTYADDQYAAALDTNILEDQKVRKDVWVTYFYYTVTLTSLDLQMGELHFELPTTKVAVGVFDSTTPLLRQIADNVLTHERSLGTKVNRHLLRTSDGYMLQIMPSRMVDDFVLVMPVDK